MWRRDEFSFEMELLATRPGSWQAVQLTDPPCTEAQLKVIFRFGTSYWNTYTVQGYLRVSCVQGITLGDISEVVMDTEQPVDNSYWGDELSRCRTNIRDMLREHEQRTVQGKSGLSRLEIHARVKGVAVFASEERKNMALQAEEAAGAWDKFSS